jgi:LysR family transcriptional regulator, low CO2-responsive transcriptional regulator
MAAKNIDLRKLRAFHTVANQGNLQRAAAQLRITVPAVFAQVRGLEDELGVKLLQRAGRGLSLTPAGKILLSKASQVFDAVAEAVESVSNTALLRERISLAVVNDLTQYLAPIIAHIVKDNPSIDLSVRVRRSPEAVEQVVDGEIDIGIGYFPKVPRGLVKTTLVQSGYSLICNSSHPLAHLRKPRLDEIARHRLVSFPARSNMGRQITSFFSAAGLALTDPIEAGSCQSSKEFAEVGVGAAIVHTVCLGPKSPRHLHVLDLGQTLGLADIAIIHRKSLPLTKGHKYLIEMLRRHALKA